MKNLILYFLIIGLTLYGMIMYNKPLLLSVFIFELLLLLLSALLLVFQRFIISSEVTAIKKPMKKDEPISIDIHVKNASFLPIPRFKLTLHYRYGFLTKGHKCVISGSVDRKSEARLRCEILPEHCGCLTVSHMAIKIFDYLNILHTTAKVQKVLKVAVMPDLYTTELAVSQRTRNLTADSDIYSKDQKGDDPSEIFRIRTYEAGDKPQNIHWKLTARKGQTMVKEFSRPIGSNVIFLLDISNELLAGLKDQSAEAMWEITFAIAHALLEAECYFDLSWIDGRYKGIVRRRIDSFDGLYETMEELICMDIYSYERSVSDIYKETYPQSQEKVWLCLNMLLNLYVNENIAYAFDAGAVRDNLATMHLVI